MVLDNPICKSNKHMPARVFIERERHVFIVVSLSFYADDLSRSQTLNSFKIFQCRNGCRCFGSGIHKQRPGPSRRHCVQHSSNEIQWICLTVSMDSIMDSVMDRYERMQSSGKEWNIYIQIHHDTPFRICISDHVG